MLRTKLDNEKIPYFKMKIKRKEVIKNGITKIEKVCSDLPFEWEKKTYEEAMKWNNDDYKGVIPNAMNVNLRNTNYVVVDIDEEDKSEKMKEENGSSHITNSTGKKMPHLWRSIHPDDKHKKSNDSNVDFGDLCYLNVFEKWNAKIDKGELPVFDKYNNYFTTETKTTKTNTIKHTTTKTEGDNNNERYLGKRISDDVVKYLNILPNDNEDWNFWWKIIKSVKNIHPRLKHVALKWSKKSTKHNDVDFNKYWDDDLSENYNGLNMNVLKNYCAMKCRDEYLRVISQKLNMTPEYFCDLFMEKFGNDKLIYTDSRLFIFIDNNWFEDNDCKILKKKIREITQQDLKNSKEDYELNEPSNPNLSTVVDSLEKIQRRGLVDDISIFIMQNLQFNNCNLEDKIKFDVNKEQKFNLHFKNGVLELDTMTFRDRTFKDYVTVGNSVNMWNFNDEPNETLIKEVEEDFRRVQTDDQQLKFMLEWLAYNLTGDTSRCLMKFNIGLRASNGKTTEFNIHQKAFPKLTKNVDKDYFSMTFNKRHKTKIELIQRPIRLVYIEELDEKLLDSGELKDCVDGKNQNCEIMYGTTCEGAFQCKFNFLGQREPVIKEDEGILRRGMLQNYNSKFTDEVDEPDFENRLFPKILNFEDKYDSEDYKNAYLWLLINNYQGNSFKIPKINVENFKSHIQDINEDRELAYLFTDGEVEDWISKKEIATLIKKPINSVKGFVKEYFPNSIYNSSKMANGSRGSWNKIKLKL